ncbi:MAG: glycosyltransferase [Bacteroidetes bacterium]|nr:MAG: glycosyltransferase [Bacteroidota bacterium]
MISIVIPIFNEAENLRMLHDRLVAAAPSWGEDYEIILVDDGSSDRSFEIMEAFARQNPRFKIIKLSRNFGHQAAISAGLKYAKGDAVVIMDGDLQDPPEELNRFLAKWREGYQVVYAIRTKRKEGLHKRFAYKLFYRLLDWVSDIDIPLDSGDFCVMDRKVVHALVHEMPEQNRFVRGLRAYAGFRQIGVAYERSERAAGEPKYTFRKLVNLAVDGLLDFSTFPLRMATYLGFFIAFPSFLMGIFFIFHRLLNFKVLGYSPEDTPGLATLAVGLFFLSGVMLIMMGIIGEYLGRIYKEVKRRPFFIVDELIEYPTEKKAET